MTGWPQDAYVGQKVICIDTPTFKPLFGSIPKINSIYTIKAIRISPKTNLHFELEEIFDIHYECMNWEAHRFRPAQSTEKGMKILTEILVTKKIKEDA